MVPPRSNRISRVPPYSRTKMLSTGTGLSPTMADLSKSFPFLHPGHWPGPRSLATTNGVSVDVLSSRYLDVSVPWVSSLSGDHNGRVSPFGNPRIKAYSQLPEAYRSVLRPSSPLTAKASIKCSSYAYFSRLRCLNYELLSALRRTRITHSSSSTHQNLVVG